VGLDEITKGDSIAIIYDPQNPKQAIIKGAGMLPEIMFGAIGVFFGGIGVGMGIRRWRKDRMSRWLLANGVRVKGRVDKIDQDRSIKINGRSPFVIYVAWEGPNDSVFLYKSDHLWEHPQVNAGDTIAVMIDPQDPNRYYVVTDTVVRKNVVDLTS
jgi:hypothetical protein